MLAQGDAFLMIDLQQVNGRSACRRAADEDRSMPAEVARPFHSAWMEERHEPSRDRIDGRQVSALVEIAPATGQGQIGGGRRTAMLAGDDVLELKWLDKRVCLRQTAVLTTVVCAAA